MLKGFDLAIDSIAGSFIITDVYGFPSLKGFDLAIDESATFVNNVASVFPSLKGFDLAIDQLHLQPHQPWHVVSIPQRVRPRYRRQPGVGGERQRAVSIPQRVRPRYRPPGVYPATDLRGPVSIPQRVRPRYRLEIGWQGPAGADLFPSLKGFDLAIDSGLLSGFHAHGSLFPSLKGFDLAIDNPDGDRRSGLLSGFHPSKGSTSL